MPGVPTGFRQSSDSVANAQDGNGIHLVIHRRQPILWSPDATLTGAAPISCLSPTPAPASSAPRGVESERTDLPWVGHVSPKWEPEPLRWLGVNAGLMVAGAADRAEARRGRTTWHSSVLKRLIG